LSERVRAPALYRAASRECARVVSPGGNAIDVGSKPLHCNGSKTFSTGYAELPRSIHSPALHRVLSDSAHVLGPDCQALDTSPRACVTPAVRLRCCIPRRLRVHARQGGIGTRIGFGLRYTRKVRVTREQNCKGGIILHFCELSSLCIAKLLAYPFRMRLTEDKLSKMDRD
jgi:hypothetical protein